LGLDDSQWSGCLLVVASRSEVAGAIEAATRQAGAKVLLHPALGDFIEIRFVDLGAKAEEVGAAVERIRAALLQPLSGATSNYFGLAVVDNRVAQARRLLFACASDPVVAALKPVCQGFAAIDDGSSQDSSAPVPPVTLLAPEAADIGDRLAEALYSFSHELMRVSAGTSDPGVSRKDLVSLGAPLAPESRASSGEPEGSQATTSPGGLSQLEPVSVFPETVAPPPPAHVPPPSPSELAAWTPPPIAPAPAADQPAGAMQRLASLFRRFAPSERLDGKGTLDKSVAPVFVAFISGVTVPFPKAAWRRGRDLVLALDEALESAPLPDDGFEFHLHLLGGTRGTGRSLLPAGDVRRRDFDRPAGLPDVVAQLNLLRETIRRDVELLTGAGRGAIRPAVLLLSAEVPLADGVSITRYSQLVAVALTTWVMLEPIALLVSPHFRLGDADVVQGHPGLVLQLRDRLVQNARVARATAGGPSLKAGNRPTVSNQAEPPGASCSGE